MIFKVAYKFPSAKFFNQSDVKFNLSKVSSMKNKPCSVFYSNVSNVVLNPFYVNVEFNFAGVFKPTTRFRTSKNKVFSSCWINTVHSKDFSNTASNIIFAISEQLRLNLSTFSKVW